MSAWSQEILWVVEKAWGWDNVYLSVEEELERLRDILPPGLFGNCTNNTGASAKVMRGIDHSCHSYMTV